MDGFANQKDQVVESRSITPKYFDAMQIPLLAGRYFTESDDAGPAHPVIINEQFARTYFANRDPIGGRISGDEKHAQWNTVIGVVADVRHTSLEEDPQPQMYSTNYDSRESSLAVRSTLPPAVMANEIRSALKATDPDVTFSDVQTMGDLVSIASARRRFQTSLLTAFAVIALFLALVGLYGLMAFSVNRRTREVGIRMALGAERRDVLLPRSEECRISGRRGPRDWTGRRMGRDAPAQVVSLWRERSRSIDGNFDFRVAACVRPCRGIVSGAAGRIYRSHAGATYRIGDPMRKLRAFWKRIAGLLHAGRGDHEFSDELESHIAMHVEDGVRSGLSAEEARRRALIQLGGAEQVRQSQRERRTLPMLESLARDLRYAFRTLAKHPAVTAIAVLSIGLGIGANATIFSMVSRFVLRPAPVGDPSTLLALHIQPQGDPCCNPFPLPLYNDLRDQAKSFSGVAAYYELIPASLSGSGEPERIWGQAVSANFFDVLELPMVLGRGFSSGEDKQPAVVISARLWQRRFASDHQIIGKTITLSGRSFTVVGIAPASFHSVDQILDTQFWVPLGIATQLVPNLPPADSREFHWLAVVARLKPGISRTQAAAELDTLAKRFALAYPKTDKGNAYVFEQAGSLPPRERTAALTFLAALSIVVLLLLAIAGANVANLLFAQAAGRQREMAVRIALGATRARLRGQLLIESTLIGLGGGMLGALFRLSPRSRSLQCAFPLRCRSICTSLSIGGR